MPLLTLPSWLWVTRVVKVGGALPGLLCAVGLSTKAMEATRPAGCPRCRRHCHRPPRGTAAGARDAGHQVFLGVGDAVLVARWRWWRGGVDPPAQEVAEQAVADGSGAKTGSVVACGVLDGMGVVACGGVGVGDGDGLAEDHGVGQCQDNDPGGCVDGDPGYGVDGPVCCYGKVTCARWVDGIQGAGFGVGQGSWLPVTVAVLSMGATASTSTPVVGPACREASILRCRRRLSAFRPGVPRCYPG